MKNKLKIFLLLLAGLLLIYEGYYYVSFKENSYLGVRGGSLNHYKTDFILIINDKNIDTLNVNIPSSFSKGIHLSLGKNTIKMNGLGSDLIFEKEIYFYGIFFWNIIEVTTNDFIYSRSYSVPVIE